jgi:hypothetical protein
MFCAYLFLSPVPLYDVAVRLGVVYDVGEVVVHEAGVAFGGLHLLFAFNPARARGDFIIL